MSRPWARAAAEGEDHEDLFQRAEVDGRRDLDLLVEPIGAPGDLCDAANGQIAREDPRRPAGDDEVADLHFLTAQQVVEAAEVAVASVLAAQQPAAAGPLDQHVDGALRIDRQGHVGVGAIDPTDAAHDAVGRHHRQPAAHGVGAAIDAHPQRPHEG